MQSTFQAFTFLTFHKKSVSYFSKTATYQHFLGIKKVYKNL